MDAKRSGPGHTVSEAEPSPRNPQHARTCGRGARPRRRTRPRQPRATSRAISAPPSVTHTKEAGARGPAPTPSIGRHAVTTSREAGRVYVCECVCYVCGVCFVIRTRLTRPVWPHAWAPAEGAGAPLQGHPLT